MVNTVRSFVLIAALSLSVAATLHAERAGTNPRPRVVATADSLTTFEIITYTVFSYFGY